MRIILALSATTLVALLSSVSKAAGLPVVISATVDYTHSTLTISGQNFGSFPTVTLDALSFPVPPGTNTSTVVVASFPSGKAPASFTPGTYFLTVTFKNQLPTIFGVDIGSNGPAGSAGPQGMPGPGGAPGATGPAGPAGPQGIPGPMGPPGATGSAGATGAQGLQGLQGATGATGPPGDVGPSGPIGPSGVAGPAGPAGNSVMACPNGNTTLSSGRYIDCGDGTLVDTTTQLMWEQKDSECAANDIHCVTLTYAPGDASTSTMEPGTLYTVFLATLNLATAATATDTCFANHCDWRIPTLQEALAIGIQSPCTDPCIDPVFGPSKNGPYWTSTAATGVKGGFWYAVYSDDPNLSAQINGFGQPNFARAVRGGR